MPANCLLRRDPDSHRLWGRRVPGGTGKAGYGRRRAQAILEFALVIPVFLLLVLGIFDVCRAYMAYTVTASSAREAARFGALHWAQPNWDLQAVQAGGDLAVGLDPAALLITVTEAPVGGLPYVRADVVYTFRTLTPMIARLVGDPIEMHASTVVLAG